MAITTASYFGDTYTPDYINQQLLLEEQLKNKQLQNTAAASQVASYTVPNIWGNVGSTSSTSSGSSTMPSITSTPIVGGGMNMGGVTTPAYTGGTSTGEASYYDPWGTSRGLAVNMLQGELAAGSTSDPYRQRLEAMATGQFGIDDPSYRFRFEEGQKALERSLATKGLLNSGNAAIELQQYGQNMASTEYGNQFNRLLAGMSGVEQTYDTQMQRLMKLAGADISPVQAGLLGVEQGKLGINAQELANEWALRQRELDIKAQIAQQNSWAGLFS
jgi:hypothetical protein